MPTTEPPNPTGNGFSWRNDWRTSATGETGGIYGKPRVRAGYDKIRALDINQLREELELLVGHTHEYEDSATVITSGGTTTCG